MALLVAHGHAVGARFEGTGLSACNGRLPPPCPTRRGSGTCSRRTSGWGRAAMPSDVSTQRRIASTSRGRPLLPYAASDGCRGGWAWTPDGSMRKALRNPSVRAWKGCARRHPRQCSLLVRRQPFNSPVGQGCRMGCQLPVNQKYCRIQNVNTHTREFKIFVLTPTRQAATRTHTHTTANYLSKHHAHSLSTFHTHTLAHTARSHTYATPVRTHTRNQPNQTARPALLETNSKSKRIHTFHHTSTAPPCSCVRRCIQGCIARSIGARGRGTVQRRTAHARQAG